MTNKQGIESQTPELSTYFESIIESMPDMLWVKDARGVFVTCNAVVERYFGAPRRKILGKTDFDFVDVELANNFRNADLAVLASGIPEIKHEWLTFAGTKEARLFETKKSPVRDSDGNIFGVLGISRDITRHNAALAAQVSLSRALKMIGSCNHAMMHAEDEQLLLEKICDLAVAIGGYRVACVSFAEHDDTRSVKMVAWSQGGDLFVKPLRLRWGENDLETGTIGRAIRDRKTIVNRDFRTEPTVQAWLAHAEAHWLRSSISIPLVSGTDTIGALTICSSMTDAFGIEEQTLLEEMAADLAFGIHILRARVEQDAAKRKLTFLAHHDSLTGTPNRIMMREHFTRASLKALAEQTSIVVLLIDLDNFKFVNDSLGHDYGDKLLVQVTRRLQRRVKNSGLVCRYGGDEFAIILHPVCSVDLLKRYLTKLIRDFTAPITVGNYPLDVTISAGVSVFPDHADNLDELLRYADTALQWAKRNGKNTYSLFDATMRSDSQRLVRLQGQLRNALSANELTLHYQPKLDIISNRIVGAEALIRWQHPENGLISPADFLPLAERTGMIIQVDEWVIDEVCRQLSIWSRKEVIIDTLAVNISALELRRGNLIQSLSQSLKRWKVPANKIELELTEGILVDDPEIAIRLIGDIRRLGVKISIDDFGTGYSSLAYLGRLPVDRLKVDQSFIREMVHDSQSLAIVKTIIQLGRNLNLTITAEGVESRDQFDILRSLECDEIQGYLISKPLSAEDFELHFKTHVAFL